METGVEHPGNDIATHITGWSGHDEHGRHGIGFQADLTGFEDREIRNRGDVGIPAEIARFDPQQQVGHGGIAGDNHVADGFRFGSGAVQGFADEVVDGGQGHAAEFFNPVFFCTDDAVDHIVAAIRLAVVAGGGCQHRAIGHIYQVDHDGGRAHVDGQAQGWVPAVAGAHLQNFIGAFSAHHRDGDIPLVPADDPGKLSHDLDAHVEPGHITALPFQSAVEPVQVADRIVKGGGLQGQRDLFQHGVDVGNQPF